MSEYIKALKRLREPQPPPAAATTPPPAQRLAAPNAAAAASPSSISETACPEAFKDLYDSLRLAAPSDATRRFVFAGADAGGATSRVVDGLEQHIDSLGFRILRAELSLEGGRPILRRQREQPLASLTALGLEFSADLKPLDLSNSAAQAEVAAWLAAASRVADAVLIEGCPLSESVDAALLARSCDGLVLVAQAGVTARATLGGAAQRVRAAGCRVLGLALVGSKHPLPSWMRRFFERSRTLSPFVEE